MFICRIFLSLILPGKSLWASYPHVTQLYCILFSQSPNFSVFCNIYYCLSKLKELLFYTCGCDLYATIQTEAEEWICFIHCHGCSWAVKHESFTNLSYLPGVSICGCAVQLPECDTHSPERLLFSPSSYRNSGCSLKAWEWGNGGTEAHERAISTKISRRIFRKCYTWWISI